MNVTPQQTRTTACEGPPDILSAVLWAWLTPIQSNAINWLMPESDLKRQLVDLASISPGQRVLNIGVGLGTLALLVQAAVPGAKVIGLDDDLRSLAVARAKIASSERPVALAVASGTFLPFADRSLDRVIATFAFRGLSRWCQQTLAGEAWRVLRAGGELHIIEFGEPEGALAGALSLLLSHPEPSGPDSTETPWGGSARGATLGENPGWPLLGPLTWYVGRRPDGDEA